MDDVCVADVTFSDEVPAADVPSDDEEAGSTVTPSVLLSPEKPQEVLDEIAEEQRCNVSSEQRSEEQWCERNKHFFILTSAGKPVFTRYGDESDFSELFGILQVLISMAQAGKSGENIDFLRRVTAGPGFSIHFHTVGDLSYVAVTRTGESTKACVRQLKLLHLQLISVIPTVNAVLKKSPGFDVRRYFSSSDASVMRMLIKRMSNDPVYAFRAAQILPLPLEVRREYEKILVDSRADEDHLYSLLVLDGRIVASISPKEHPLHVDDFLILLNFSMCIVSSQQGEIWAPICLPRFNDTGYMWCLCADLASNESEKGLLLIQLATTQEAFPTLSAARATVADKMHSRNLTQEICVSSRRCADFPLPDAFAPALQWFLCCTDSKQLVMSSLPPPLEFSRKAKKAALRLVVQLRDKLTLLSRASTPILVHCTSDASYVISKVRGMEVCTCFLPCVGKKEMIDATARLGKLVESKENTYTLTKAIYW